jgi:hypothetical protein
VPLEMKKKSQHIIAISVLVCFLIYTSGTIILFEYRLDNIQSANNVRKKVSENEHVLIHLEIPLHEVHWEHEYEFFWNGFMYDISEKEIINDTLFCLAYQDAEETELKKELSNQMKSEQTQNKERNPNNFNFPVFITSLKLKLFHPINYIVFEQYITSNSGRNFSSAVFIPPDLS